VLFFTHPGTNSRDHLLDLAEGYERAGCEIVQWELAPVGHIYAEAGAARAAQARREIGALLRAFIVSNGIDLTVGLWANGLLSVPHAATSTFFDQIDVPHVLFWFDAPHWAHQGGFRAHFCSPLVGGRRCFHQINNAGLGAEMAEVLGFSNVVVQPYGINERLHAPRPDVKAEFDVVLGLGPGDAPPTPLMEKALLSREPDHDEIRRQQAEAARAVINAVAARAGSEHERAVAGLGEALLQMQLRARDVPMLDRLKALKAHDPRAGVAAEVLIRRPDLWVDLTAAIRSIEQWERAFIPCWLARRYRVACFGAADLMGWAAAPEKLGPVSHEGQSMAYARGRIGLSVMRWQDDVGLNVKPFEITAAGVPAVVQARGGLSECFDVGREVLCCRTAPEAAAAIDHLLGDERAAKLIADAGLARTTRDHTWTTRAFQMLGLLDEIRRRSPTSPRLSEPSPAAAGSN